MGPGLGLGTGLGHQAADNPCMSEVHAIKVPDCQGSRAVDICQLVDLSDSLHPVQTANPVVSLHTARGTTPVPAGESAIIEPPGILYNSLVARSVTTFLEIVHEGRAEKINQITGNQRLFTQPAGRQVTGQAADNQVEGARRVQTLNIGGSTTTTVSFIVEQAA